MKPILMFPGIGLLCACGGWLAAGGGTSELRREIAVTVDCKSAERSLATRSRPVPPEVEAKLRPLRAARTPEERLRAMTLLAGSIPVRELATWYEAGWIERRETLESLQFYHITKQRWLADDGAGMMDHYLKKDRARARDLALDWGQVAPAAAFAFGEALMDSEDRSILMGSVAAAASEIDPEIALKALARYNAPRSGASWSVDSIIGSIAKSAPDLLKREMASLPEKLGRYAKAALAREQLNTDLVAGVAALAEEKDGKEQFITAVRNSTELTERILAQPEKLPEGWLADLITADNFSIVRRDPKRWLELDLDAIGLPEDQVRKLRTYALRRLMYSHPQRLQEVLAATTVDPATRNQAIHSAVESMANVDRAKAAELIAQLTNPQERAFAQARLDEVRPREEMPGIGTPEEIGKLAAFKGGNDITNAMEGWGEDEIKRAAKAFEKLPPSEKDALAIKLGNSPMWSGRCIPLCAAAYDHLLGNTSLQVHQGRTTQERAYAFASLYGYQDPAAASRWVESLPAGEPRVWAAKNVAASWAEYYPEESRKWVEGLDFRAEVQAAKMKER